MKTLKILAVALALCISGVTMAQGPQIPQDPQGQQQGQRPQRQRMAPEQMAKAQTERMAKSLDLSEEQQKKLYDYNLATLKEQQKQREQGQGQGQRPDFRNMSEQDRQEFFKKMQEERKAQEAAQDKAIKEILTDAQYKKWQKQKKQQEMRQRQMMQQRMEGGEGGFGGGGEMGF